MTGVAFAAIANGDTLARLSHASAISISTSSMSPAALLGGSPAVELSVR